MEKTLTTRTALEGERKLITVLFADIADSSALAQRIDPERLHELLGQVLQLVAEAVHRYEGTVNQYLGDGLMALFGAPIALEDHPLRAVQAALAIQETIRGYSAQFQREHGSELCLRVGINTGPVVVGRIGDDLRMDYTAVGNTTHLASRLQALADPGTILMSEATHRFVEGYVLCESLGPIEVRGQRGPVVTYRVTGRRRWRSRLEMSATRGLTQLAGRRRELALLHDCLHRVESGHGQVVGVIGEPGVGKSRLLYELHASISEERFDWLEGHCLTYGRTVPYGPVLEILGTLFHVEEGDNALQIQEKLRHGIQVLDPALEPMLPFLEALFALPGSDDALRHLDRQHRRQQTLEAVRAVVAAASHHRPQILVCENLHWIDQSSEDLLALLAGSLSGLPVLIMTTHRTGYTVRWADKAHYTQIALDGLARSEIEEMLAALLGERECPPEFLRFIRDKADGNPLFIEEVTQALKERGLLVRDGGHVRLIADPALEWPATIQDIIQARVDLLEKSTQGHCAHRRRHRPRIRAPGARPRARTGRPSSPVISRHSSAWTSSTKRASSRGWNTASSTPSSRTSSTRICSCRTVRRCTVWWGAPSRSSTPTSSRSRRSYSRITSHAATIRTAPSNTRCSRGTGRPASTRTSRPPRTTTRRWP